MNTQPITKKKYAWDPVVKSTRQYQRKIDAAHREIDELVRTGRPGKVVTPNYAREVIAPLAEALAEALPEYGLSVEETVEVIGSEAYFPIYLGGLRIGGFSYPGPKAAQINFTIFAHEKPWGRSIAVKKLPQLVELLAELAGFVKPDGKKTRNDE